MSVASFDDLTPVQKDVVNATAQTLLVLGGAGVGKTTTALWAGRCEVERRRATTGDASERVLFVTFSRTAVMQIQDRAGGVLAGVADAVEIMTFHGLAYRWLRAFGRYVGVPAVPMIVGEAREKLIGRPGDESLTYADLLPLALRLAEDDGPIGGLLRSRWGTVICDEFQDTDNLEWRLLERLGEEARLVLLADPNQMIYQFKGGVSEARLDAARARDGFAEIALPPGSHRDPTQVLPDAAAEVRWRRFDAAPVVQAVEMSRLMVRADVPDNDQDRVGVIANEIEVLRDRGHRTIGIFAKTNNDAAGLSVVLTEHGINHVPVGFSEAYGEALASMTTMAEFAQGKAIWQDVRSGLAVVLTASVRSPVPPSLAVALHGGGHMSRAFEARLEALQVSLRSADRIEEAAQVAADAWEDLGLTAGRRSWRRAARAFIALVSRAAMDRLDPLARLSASVSEIRNASFVELDAGDSGAIQLMNFSQTKGREADAVILSYTSSDWYGHAGEPYDEASRLLYVSMTRARGTVIVLLPLEPHPLVAPFRRYA